MDDFKPETEPVETPIPEMVSQNSSENISSVPSETSPQEVPQMQFVPKPTPPPPPKPRRSFMGVIVNIFLLIILFGVGIWLSSIFRQYLPQSLSSKLPAISTNPTPLINKEVTPTPSSPFGSWVTYQLHNGLSYQPISGISYKLPPDVLEPVCDGINCPSEGSYLPGGTRFTIAYRGPGQVLRDFRGAVITDLSGKSFETKATTILGRKALEYTGSFIGNTLAGYSFSQMHGLMIEINDTNSIEINHFTPNGITADFASDDEIFTQIVANLDLSGITNGLQKGSVIISPTPELNFVPTINATPTSSISIPTPTLNYLF